MFWCIMPDNQISTDNKPEIKYLYAIGETVVTKDAVPIYYDGNRKGTALVGWKWIVQGRWKDDKGHRIKYSLSDASGMYWCEVKEDQIWKKYDQLTTEQQATAKLGKEIIVK